MSENSSKISGQALLGTLAERRPFWRIRLIWLCIMLLRQWWFMAAASSALRHWNGETYSMVLLVLTISRNAVNLPSSSKSITSQLEESCVTRLRLGNFDKS